MRSSGSKRSLRVAFAVLLVLAALAIAAPAALAYGSIYGYVYSNANLTSLENIDVYAFDAATPGIAQGAVPDLADAVGSDRTEFGYYDIQNLPGGPLANPTEYRLWFQDMSPFNHYVAQWYNGSSPYDAAQGAWSSVFVVDNQQAYGGEEYLWPACTISGNVVAKPGIYVYVYDSTMGDPDAFVEAIQGGGVTPDAVTDAAGNYMVEELNPTGGAAGPAYYKVYFYDPSGEYAPEWYDDVLPWYSGTQLTQTIGAEGMSASAELALAGTIAGSVDGDVGDGTEYDLAGIQVSVYAAWGQIEPVGFGYLFMGEAVTDSSGHFSIAGLPVGNYFVRFTDPSGDYFNKWFSVSSYAADNGNPFLDGAELVEIDDPGYQDNGVYALMKPIPRISFVHPPYGVNDGPDRYETEVAFIGWGLHFVDHVDIWKLNPVVPFFINRLGFWADSPFAATGVYNLAAPLAPTGTYTVSAWYYDYYLDAWTWGYLYDAFQVVNSWVPTVPATPPSPTVPVLPAEPTPIVTPQPPAPEPPAAPVAGPVAVSAEKAAVKKGALATLRFQVSESVLGGTADVKVVIATKAGKVVKQVKKSVTMNAAASVSFRCKLAKGSYTYTVSAGAASASSTLVVK